MKKQYLLDKDFLKEIDGLHNKEQYIKITALSFIDEKSIAEIQGKVINGSITVSGTSSVRRTGNITVLLDENENNIEDYKNIFAINKKYKIEVGFLNTTEKYLNEKIIWFPQGTFLINSPNISYSESGVTLSAQLQDKMCLLNGTYGGELTAAIRFHEMEELKITKVEGETKEQIIMSYPTIYQIILELVNHLGGISLSKILISDLDELVKAPQTWAGGKTLYYGIDKDKRYFYTTDKQKLSNILKEYKDTDEIGHIYTKFIWPTSTGGELIGNPGESVTTILDKVANLLGNFEYFFDIDGNFVFQQKRNYLYTSLTKTLEKNMTLDYSISRGNNKSVYTFGDSTLITSYSNSPQFTQIKNDFVIWGVKKIDGQEFPIRYHLAIDDKPILQEHDHLVYWVQPEDAITQAKKYIDATSLNEIRTPGVIYKYKDKFYVWDTVENKVIEVSVKGSTADSVKSLDWRQELYLQGSEAQNTATDTNYYYTELINEWPKLFDVEKQEYFNKDKNTNIDYFLDLIDGGALYNNISVKSIGRRTKVVQQRDSKVNCIFEPEIPDIILVTSEQEEDECIKRGQSYAWVDTEIKDENGEVYIINNLSGGGKYNSAYEVAINLLYQYTSYNNAITIQAIPIYYLEPNTRISVYDKKTGISGDYIINSISLPLGIDGTMSISATKAEQKM